MDPVSVHYFVPLPSTLPLPLGLTACLWTFLVGACVGSFLNVVIARVPEGLSIVKPRSRCPGCGHEIAWYDNVPLLSWVVLRAKCRGCKLPISARYPFVELLIGMTALALFVRGGITVISVEAFVLTTLLVALAFIDLDHKAFPLSLLFAFPVVTLAFTAAAWAFGQPTGPTWVDPILYATGLDGVIDRLLGGSLGFVFLAAVVVIGTWYLRKVGRIGDDETAMGWGDPILLGGLGLWLGWRAIPFVVTLAAFQGALIGVVMLRRAKADDESPESEEGVPEGAIPFGPFLAMGALEMAFFGREITSLLGRLMGGETGLFF